MSVNPFESNLSLDPLALYSKYLAEQQDFSPATQRGYLGDVRQFVSWYQQECSIGGESPAAFDLAQIATPTLTKYRYYLQNTLNLKPASINRYLVSLKRFFVWAVDEAHLVQRDPARPVKLVKRDTPSPRQLTDAEENLLVAEISQQENLRDRAMIILMLHTGLRVGEVCRLQRKHILYAGRTARLRIYGKGNRYREVPLNITAREAVSELLNSLPEDENIYLFIGEQSKKPITERTVGRIVKQHADKAGVSDLSPHDLRHRFAYRLIETNRVSLHRVAELMGHDSLDTTRLYIKSTQADLQRAVDSIAWE